MAVTAQRFPTISNPFSDEVTSRNYFEDESRSAITQKIAHLLEFGTDILFVHGELESGKTTLIKQLISEKQRDWQCIYTSAEEANSVNSFLKVIAKHLNIGEQQPESVLNQLADTLTLSHEKGVFSILFVDDADRLDPALLKLITSIAGIAIGGQPVLRIALIGREVPTTIKQLINENSGELTITEVPAFSEEQTGVYIHHRLAAAGSSDQGLFTPAVISRIHRQSRGQPSHINALAHSTIAQPATAGKNKHSTRRRSDTNAGNQFALKMIAFALAISVIISLFFFRAEQQPEDTLVQTTNTETTLEIPQPEATNEPTPEPAKLIPEPAIPTPVIAEAPVITKNAAPELIPQKAEIQVEAEVTTQPAKNTTKETSSKWKTEAWIQSRPSGNLTLQLIALGSPAAVQKFITDNRIGNQAAYFKTIKNGKTFYAVIYGDFSTRRAANDASVILANSLKLKPWARSFSSIQKLIQP